MTRTGGCRCGAVRYTLSEAPAAVRMCWCRDCQYWAAGNAAVNLLVARAAVDVHGELREWESIADSGHHMRRSFCPACGTQVFSQAQENRERMVIRIGTLDDFTGLSPQSVIWTDSAPAWARIDPALPAFPRQPPA